jgi:hypothetical protein
MWFFEDGDYKLHLTFVEGHNEAEVDVDKLTSKGLAYLIGSVQGGQVQVDESLSNLHKRLSALLNPEIEIEAELPPMTPEQRMLQEKMVSSQARRYQKAEALARRCQNLAASTYKAIRSGLAGEDSQLIVLEVLKLEKQGKRRKTVLKFLEDKLKSIRRGKLRQANKALKSQPDDFSVSDNTIDMGYNTPEEKEIELIEFDIIPLEKTKDDTPSGDQPVDSST